MGLKKFISIVIVLCLFSACFSTAAYCDNTQVIEFGRIYIAMPEVKVELKGSGYNTEEIEAYLATEQLKLTEIHTYTPEENSSRIFALVDISGSMRNGFELVRKNMLSVVEAMGPKDELVLLTFGGTDVDILLQGGESRAQILDTVNSLVYTNGDTPFYEALGKAYQISNAKLSEFDREYIIAFSDGADIQVGATTYNEITDSYKTHSLPLYAACSSFADKDDADRFGELARSSGGSLVKIQSEEDFTVLTEEIADVTICSFVASTNVADGSTRQLSVKRGSLMAEIHVPVSRSIPDNVPPEIVEAGFNSEKNAIELCFSEPVKGALDTSAYKILTSSGDLLEVSFVEEGVEENSVYITVKNLRAGIYTISVKGITDISQQENPLDYSATLTVSKADAHTENLDLEQDKFPAWIIALIIVLMFALAGGIAAVILTSRKKSRKDTSINQTQGGAVKQPVVELACEVDPAQQAKIHLKNTSSVKLGMRVKTGNSIEQNMVNYVASSLMVGRSDICDVYIDDTKLSRQHFVIENEDGRLFVTDLQSRNGTFLNGTRVYSRQLLHSGDKIVAGLSDIVITF